MERISFDVCQRKPVSLFDWKQDFSGENSVSRQQHYIRNFPPPSLLYACVFVETGIPLELSNRPTLSSDRIDSHRHRLFELKRAAPFQTSQNVSICAAAIAERGKKKVSRCSKINRDTSVKRIRGIPVVRK